MASGWEIETRKMKVLFCLPLLVWRKGFRQMGRIMGWHCVGLLEMQKHHFIFIGTFNLIELIALYDPFPTPK